MKDLMKWLAKVALQGLVWVFIFSIQWDGRPLFTRAHDVFVQNELVATMDEELGDLWGRLSRAARMTFSEPPESEEVAL